MDWTRLEKTHFGEPFWDDDDDDDDDVKKNELNARRVFFRALKPATEKSVALLHHRTRDDDRQIESRTKRI